MIEQAQLISNPFPGLRPFETCEHELFFGRDGQSDEVLTRLRDARFVAVVGTSGSGKSSLVRAGLLPALFSGHMMSAGSNWRVAVFRPGSNPIGNLAVALSEPDVFGAADREGASAKLMTIERTLRRSSLGLLEVVGQARMQPQENLLILVDQFEELFRFRKKTAAAHPEDEAAAFVKLLLETKQPGVSVEEKLPIYVILTMRSDYLGDCANFWGLPEAINEGQYLIPRMTDDDRREAINGPIILGGASATPPLVNQLLNDAGDDPASLPILQHALMRTWDYWKLHARPDEPLDLPHYEKIGGMENALSNHADEAYLELSPELQGVAEKLFKCLTEKEADSREGRRPSTVGEICAVAEAEEEKVKTVIESFRREGRSFLMPPPGVPLTADTLIDISHESLIRGWQRLRAWVDEEAQSARQYKRLADTAAGFPKEETYLRDPALQIGLKWLEDNKPTRAWAMRYHQGFDKTTEYLAASKANRKAEEAEKERLRKEEVERELRHAEAIAAEQKRRVKLLRLGLALLSVLLIGMLGLTVYAFKQRASAQNALGEAKTQAANAEKAKADAEAQRNNALQATEEADKQKNRAQEALSMAESERDRAKRAEMKTAEQRDAANHERAEAVKQRDIARRATSEAEKQKGIAEKQKGIAELALADALKAKTDAESSRAAALLAQQEAVRERDAAEKALKIVKDIDLSADYSVSVMRGHTQPLKKVSFSPDDSMVMTSTAPVNTPVEFLAWDPRTGGPIFWPPNQPNSDAPTFSTFSESGKLALITSNFHNDTTTHLWDMETGKSLAEMPWTELIVGNSVFSPDDRFIVVNDIEGGRVAVFDAKTAAELGDLESGLPSAEMAFSPNSKLLATVEPGALVIVWDVVSRQKVAEIRGHLGGVNQASFSPDSNLVVTASADGTARLWDARTGKELDKAKMAHEGPVNSARFDSEGRYIVTTSKNRAYLWEPKSPGDWTELSANSPTILAGHERDVTDAVFTRDGNWVVTISQDRTARLWRAKTVPPRPNEKGIVGPPVVASRAVFRGHIKPLTSVAVSKKNSDYVVTGGEDGTARVWSLKDIGTFSVGKLEVKAEPSTLTGKCPLAVKLTGAITAEGGAGVVKYKFVRSDNTSSLEQELIFDAPGTKEVSDERIVGATGWGEIQITEPAAMKSERASFTVTCEGVEQGVLTDEQLRQIMPNSTAANRALYLPRIRKAMEEFGIDTPVRQAAFLAEVGFNTMDLTKLEGQNTDAHYEEKYGYRKDLGNYEAGDGAKYKPRGAFDVIGRSLYQAYSDPLGVNLLEKPELAASPEVAFRTAALFWQKYNLNDLADKADSIEPIAKIVFGEFQEPEKQQAYFERAKSVLRANSR